ncbi:HEAT repeat domain-containing protein [Bremerella alba]|uniref:HEAT repeat domain-containing protein n=1 Tax=Bremerella alba TaxID=980252 RepID=A0A7V8V1T2_9BACT|nr:HEAT repeat domain-containing protein [Bremerella alba]MBA2113329.1 hypothetical protein [Bremerella alba]
MNATHWKFQFGLGWAAYWILVCALALGWFRAHTQAVHDLERLPTEIAVMDEQIVVLTDQIEVNRYYPDLVSSLRITAQNVIPRVYLRKRDFPESTEVFLQQLEAIREHERASRVFRTGFAFGLACQLISAPEHLFHEAIPRSLEYLEVPEDTVREEMIRTFHALVVYRPEQMQTHLSLLVPALVERLKDNNKLVRIAAVQALESIGLQARIALSDLQEIEANDDDPAAVFAALAIEAIDVDYQAVARLKQLVRNRKSNWELAAAILPERVSAPEAEAFLKEQLVEATHDQDRQFFARTLSQLKRRQMFPGEAE